MEGRFRPFTDCSMTLTYTGVELGLPDLATHITQWAGDIPI
jgi:hypothetical protein